MAGSVVGRVQRRQQQRFAAEDAAVAAASPVAAPASPAASTQESSTDATDHKLAQLKQLGELLAAGVLTDEEFQGEKAKILAL